MRRPYRTLNDCEMQHSADAGFLQDRYFSFKQGLNVAVLAKILLVDDERGFVAVLAQRLTRRHYLVTAAHSGKEALARLEEEKNIEVVILDVEMPVLDGIETLKRIRKKWPLVEVVMLTGHATIDSAVKAIKMGACDYLIKPIEIEQLVSKSRKQPAESDIGIS